MRLWDSDDEVRDFFALIAGNQDGDNDTNLW